MKVPFTLRTDKDLLEQARKQAKREQKTLSRYVAESLETFLHEKGYLSSVGQPETRSEEA